MVRYEMAADRKGSTVTRSEVWLKTHKKKNGKPLPGAEPFVEQVEAIMKESEGSSIVHPLSIDNDPLSQVLGKKGKGLPGVGTFVSKRKYNATLHSHIVCSEERNKKMGLEKKVDSMQADLDFVVGYCKGHQVIGATKTPLPMPETEHTHISNIANMSTPQTINRSSSILPSMMTSNARDQCLDTGNSMTSTPVIKVPPPRYIELLDWNQNCVALAKEVTDPIHISTCHNYRVNEYEMKVSMCVRKIYSTKLYKETPDSKIIGEVGLGDFLVWPKSHILFREPPDAN